MRQISLQVSRQNKGVGLLAETRERQTVSLPRVRQLAGEQQLTQPITELDAAVQGDQPCSGQSGAPIQIQQQVKVLIADLPCVLSQPLRTAPAAFFIHQVPVQQIQVAALALGCHVPANKIQFLRGRGRAKAHRAILPLRGQLGKTA